MSIENIKRLRVEAGIVPSERQYLYRIVSKYRPKCILETGSGVSSLCFLEAFKKIEGGSLYSIDLPELENRGSCKITWQRQPNWYIYEEDILVRLPILCGQLSHIDLFFHDSEHTSQHILFEFNCVEPKLESNSLIGIHDIAHPDMLEFIGWLNRQNDFDYVGCKRHLGFWRKK